MITFYWLFSTVITLILMREVSDEYWDWRQWVVCGIMAAAIGWVLFPLRLIIKAVR